MYLLIPIEPMGAVRMTGRGKYIKKNALRYLAYKEQIQWEVKKQFRRKELLAGPIEVKITFFMPMPKSWSNKKKSNSVGTYHTKKPDTDNLVKGIFDALNKLVWQDDNLVAKVSAKKIYAENPRIKVEIWNLREDME
jgi:Holliday junction resolvase RusA-like endonuclease